MSSECDIFKDQRHRQIDRLCQGIGTLASMTRGAEPGVIAEEIVQLRAALDSVALQADQDAQTRAEITDASFVPWGIIETPKTI